MTEANNLNEAIFEYHWQIPHLANSQGEVTGPEIDLPFDLLIGKFYDAVKEYYPYFEKLLYVTGNHCPHCRFWTGLNNIYPVLQLGPGLMTVNTLGDIYSWKEYRECILHAVNILQNTFPEINNSAGKVTLKPAVLVLKYLNNFEHHPLAANTFTVMRKKMGVGIDVNIDNLFPADSVESIPADVFFRTNFASTNPFGNVNINIGTGVSNGKVPGICTDISIASDGKVLGLETSLEKWIDSAHVLLEHCVGQLHNEI